MCRTTCQNQTFFTGFACEDLSVNLYMMNFKKGSQITHDKLTNENKKTKTMYLVLPLNHESYIASELLPKKRVPQPIRDYSEKQEKKRATGTRRQADEDDYAF